MPLRREAPQGRAALENGTSALLSEGGGKPKKNNEVRIITGARQTTDATDLMMTECRALWGGHVWQLTFTSMKADWQQRRKVNTKNGSSHFFSHVCVRRSRLQVVKSTPTHAPSPFPIESVTIMSSAATASSLTASPASCRGVIIRRSSTFHPIKQTLLRVPSHSKNQQNQNWVARRAATVVTRASPQDGDDTEAAPPAPPGSSSSRRDIINGVFFAVSLPLWKDIAHDLGYLHGKEVVFLHFFFSHPHCRTAPTPSSRVRSFV